MRRSWLPLLNQVRTSLAEMIGADLGEVVLVPNATHGINTILRNIDWEDGDIIVMCTCLEQVIGALSLQVH